MEEISFCSAVWERKKKGVMHLFYVETFLSSCGIALFSDEKPWFCAEKPLLQMALSKLIK